MGLTGTRLGPEETTTEQPRVRFTLDVRRRMRPVQPGWVVVPVKQEFTNEWYHLLGWEGLQPVIAMDLGAAIWREQFGEDHYCIATHEEWVGSATSD